MYKAKIIADSRSPQNDRLTTFVIQFPRIVLSEFNTHRMFSRNSASSRAIPFKKMVKMVEENPFIPIAWQKDHKGMQGSEYLDEERRGNAARNWHKVATQACNAAKIIHANYYDNEESKVTKQLCNRLLEPFMWHKVIITSSEEGLQNFFNLRCPEDLGLGPCFHTRYKSKKDYLKDWGELYDINGEPVEKTTNLEWLKINKSQADIHIQAIAEMMWDCYNESKPKQLEAGEWHIPFGDRFDEKRLVKLFSQIDEYHPIDINDLKVKIATARCARISYNNFEGKDDYEADIKLYERLKKDKHAVPFEHCAIAMNDEEYQLYVKGKASHVDSQYGNPIFQQKEMGWCRNFKGFISHRHQLGI